MTRTEEQRNRHREYMRRWRQRPGNRERDAHRKRARRAKCPAVRERENELARLRRPRSEPCEMPGCRWSKGHGRLRYCDTHGRLPHWIRDILARRRKETTPEQKARDAERHRKRRVALRADPTKRQYLERRRVRLNELARERRRADPKYRIAERERGRRRRLDPEYCRREAERARERRARLKQQQTRRAA